jgi:pyruvate dehydrogenase E2 component (dihydrolipoamide acetyltransferase)
MPNFGQTTAEGTIVGWLKREGDRVERGEPLAEVETDKTTVQIEAYTPGYLRRILHRESAVVAAGTPIALLTTTAEEAVESAAPALVVAAHATPAPTGAPTTDFATMPTSSTARTIGPATGPRRHPPESLEPRVLATPTARRIAEDLGVDLTRVSGSGPGGRVLEADVRAQVDAARASSPTRSDWRGDQGVRSPALLSDEVPLSNIRRTTGERMLQSIQQAPQFALSADVDLTAFERRAVRAAQTAANGKISFTAFLVHVVATALRQHPEMNSSYVDGRLRRFQDVNVGLAVATRRGLLVPVIRQTDRLSVDELASQIATLSAQARDHRLPPDALAGGTFTISNLGMYGIDRFTAILNPPEAGILAVGRIGRRPVAVERPDGATVEIRPMVSLTLTVDHRALDGADAATFLATVRDLIESDQSDDADSDGRESASR